MFVHSTQQVSLPYPAVRERLLAGAGAWLGAPAEGAYGEGERLLARVGPAGKAGLSKRVEMLVLEPRETETGIMVPVCWLATGTTTLFPRMDGTLTADPSGDGTTLGFVGRYDAPLGGVGRALDRMLLHRVAEHTVHALLRRIAEHLRANDPGPSVSSDPSPPVPAENG